MNFVGVSSLGSAADLCADSRGSPRAMRAHEDGSISAAEKRTQAIVRAGFLILAGVLVWRACRLITFSIWAVQYPYELDYVEGLIWEQMRLIADGRGYAPIEGFPAIAFPYPPVYHAVCEAMARLAGVDGLAAGRLVSLISLLVTALIGGAIVHRITAVDLPARIALVPATAAGLILLTTLPVAYWTPLMRVDMLAICFSLAGVYFSMLTLDRPRWVIAASICFLLSVYTKQVMVAAPAASFCVLLFLRPKAALVGIAICIGVGLAALGILDWASNGGVKRHLFVSNVNRWYFEQLQAIPLVLVTHAVYVGLALFAVRDRISSLVAHIRSSRSLSSFRSRLAEDRALAMSLILVAYLALSTPLLFTIAKSGASLNYIIEWANIVALFCGLGLAGAARLLWTRRTEQPSDAPPRVALLMIAALAVQAFGLPKDQLDFTDPPPPEAESRALSRMVRAATKPIISDDMVLLVRNGKEVYIEPAIIGEGSALGSFDQRPLIRDVLAGKFAFFLTAGEAGDRIFDNRYSPEFAKAVDRAYPRKIRLLGRTIHLPAR